MSKLGYQPSGTCIECSGPSLRLERMLARSFVSALARSSLTAASFRSTYPLSFATSRVSSSVATAFQSARRLSSTVRPPTAFYFGAVGTLGALCTGGALASLDINLRASIPGVSTSSQKEPVQFDSASTLVASPDESPTVEIAGQTYELAPISSRLMATWIDACYVAVRATVGSTVTLLTSSVLLMAFGCNISGWQQFLQSFRALEFGQQLLLSAVFYGGAALTFFYAQFKPVYNMIALNGQTMGKKTMGIRKLRLDGKPYGFSTYLLEKIVQSIVPAYFISLLMVMVSPKRQWLHESVANTVVVIA